MMQLLEIYQATQEWCIYFGNMYNDLRNVMGAVIGRALFVWKVNELN